jgi:mRNA guanylyltransferase
MAPEHMHGLRQEVARLLKRHPVSFPGAQPVSFARIHLEKLQQEE